MDLPDNKLLFERYHATRSIEDRNVIVVANMALLGYMAKRFLRLNPDVTDGFDELKSDGVMALVRAVEMFEPSFGASFAGYACRWIGCGMWREYRNRRGLRGFVHNRKSAIKPRQISLDAVQDAAGIELAIAAAVDPAEELHRKDVVGMLLPSLYEREHAIIQKFYFEGVECSEMAKAAGVSRQWIDQIKTRALTKMRAASVTVLNRARSRLPVSA